MADHRHGLNGVALLSAFLVLAFFSQQAGAKQIRLFAAASTTTAMNDIVAQYGATGADRVVASYASSSALAKQIVNGAPADIFVSANEDWMDYLVKNRAVAATSRRDLLTNRLVLIAPADTRWSLTIVPGVGLAAILGDGHLAMGDPDHVPAGIYGRQALSGLGVWDAVSARVARTADVRAALVLVERGEAAAGIVYATDAAITAKVRVVAVFPESSHPPIRYPAAIVSGQDTAEVRRFFRFLASDQVSHIYERYGFGLAATPSPR